MKKLFGFLALFLLAGAAHAELTSFSGTVTEYTDGDTDTTPSGGVIFYEKTIGTGEQVAVSTANALPVNIVTGSSSGTQYTEGDTDASITGNATMFESPTGTSSLVVVSTATPFPVNIVSGSSSGTQYTEGDTDSSITGTALMFESPTGTSGIVVVSSATPLPVTMTGASTGDGALQDGANSAIEATVLDYTSSNPLAVRLTNTDGDYVAAGAGTQYTDGDLDTTPTGTSMMYEKTIGTGEQVVVSTANALPVADAGGSLTVDNTVLSVVGGGTEATAQRVTIASDSTGVLSVDDNGSSLTVDNAALSVTGGGVESGALRVTVANDSTGVLSVDDNGSTLSVDDGAGSLTVDNAALSVTGGGVEASALRVTIANDSTGVVSVDDNGGTLTVDGTVTVTDGSGALNVIVDSIAAGNNNIGDVDVASIAAGNNNIGDVDVASIAAGDNNIGNVDIVTMPNVTVGTFPDNEPFNVAQINGVTPLMGNGATGTGSLRVTVASDNTAFSVNATATGAAATDAAVSGNPVYVGVRASTHSALSAVSAAGDVVPPMGDLYGRLITRTQTETIVRISSNCTASGNTMVISTPTTSGHSIYVTGGTVNNGHSSNVVVKLGNASDTQSTRIFGGELASEGGGSMLHGCSPETPCKMASDTGLFANLSGASDVWVNLTYYVGP